MRPGSRIGRLSALIGAAWLSAGSPARAASFDCAKAATPDEVATCADPRLSDLDRRLSAAFAEARSKAEADERAKVLADARASVARRQRCGADRTCLTAAYVGAIEDFQVYGATTDVSDALSAIDMVTALPPESHALPGREGACVVTRIGAVGARLEGDTTFESGTSVGFANGGMQVAYDKIFPIIQSHEGDPVLMCLTSIPKHCPPGDDRGRMYTTTNLRTHKTWSLPDSQHRCGGA